MNTYINKKISSDEEYYKLSYEILDNLSTAILILDENFNIFYKNTTASILLGASNKNPDISTLKCENLDFVSYLKKVKDKEQSIMLRDLKFKNFDRVEKIVDCNISSYFKEEKDYLLIEFNETDRLYNISLDQNLIDQQKATREMIKGLSHEIKNPLGGIMGAAQLLDKSLNDDNLTKFTKIIKKESERLLNLINSMASPSQSCETKFTNIHEITEHVIELFNYDPDTKNIEFIKDYDPSIPQLYIDKNQIIQAIINIVRNAIYAINKSGKIFVRTRTELKYTIGNTKYDLVVKIEIIDNGIGIPEEKMKEIFYPMVTTKNEGMGLGLTIAQSLISQNNGLIECSSKNGETIFSIILPWGEQQYEI